MNFIVIVSDTLRRDHLGCYGNQWISTPHIDRFAARSQVFERAYSGSFPTVPHRRDLLTGRFTASYTPWAPLSLDEVVLPQVLGEAGYTSMMIADCPHTLENGYHYDRGFDGWEWIRGQEGDRWRTWPDAPPHPANAKKIRGPERLQQCHRRNTADWRRESDRFVARTMQSACDWLEDNYRRDKFFLYVDTFDPHEPWDAPQHYIDLYDPGYKGQVVDYPLYWYAKNFLAPAELKHCRALYAAEVTLVDRWVGRVFEKIEDLGLLRNTMVLFTTDHGFLHGEHGIMGKALLTPERFTYIPLYEEINHIPWIAWWPGGRACRRRAIVQPMDIMPTLLKAAGAKVPPTVQGRSFASVLQGKARQHRRYAVSAPFLKAERTPVTVVEGRWTATIYPKTQSRATREDKAVDGYAKRQSGGQQDRDLLFDVAKDPAQRRSLAAKHPEVLSKLRRNFYRFLLDIEADDELLATWTPPR